MNDHSNVCEPSVHIYKINKILNIYQLYCHFNDKKSVLINKDKSFQWIGIGQYKAIQLDEINPTAVEKTFKGYFKNIDTDLKRHVKLFGGFHFDQLGSSYFKDFDLSHFYIPKVQIEMANGETVITLIDGSQEELNQIVRAIENLNTPIGNLNITINTPEIASVVDLDLNQFKDNVLKATQLMKTTDLDKVVLSRKKRVQLSQIDPADILYRALTNDEFSYFAMIPSNDAIFITKTPEQLVKLEGQTYVTNAIAGTMDKNMPDAKNVLLNDKKNLMEHQLVTNSIVSDLKQVTEDIVYHHSPIIMENQFFYHLYTPISGKLQNASLLDLAKILHPTPALGGFPKHLSNAFLKEANEERGLYGAPLGYMDLCGDGEFIVSIRSMLVQGSEALMFGGCGIVKDSQVDLEVHETEIKFNPMFKMLGGKL